MSNPKQNLDKMHHSAKQQDPMWFGSVWEPVRQTCDASKYYIPLLPFRRREGQKGNCIGICFDENSVL